MFKRLSAVTAVAVLLAGPAAASPAPILAPAAPWVQPPPAPPASVPAPDGAAEHALLWDEQLRLEDGGQQLFVHTRVRLQTTQGVQAAGTFALPWNPEMGDLTVHWLRVIRDGQTRDVLAKQSFQVLHREANLEASVIDGLLTAAIQPDDLRVGDIVDLAFTVSLKDPALAGHAEGLVAIPNFPIDDVRLAVSSSKGRFRWRASEPLAGLPPGPTGSAARLSVAMKAVQPLQIPEGAPARFRHGRELEVSDLASWAQASAILAPAFQAAEAIKPGSPLSAEVARVAALSSDPKVRAQAALDLVQNDVRYLAINIHDGGLLPADAETTWTRRFGDCKGKTVLLAALLRALGIDAEPALVSTASGDGLDARLPSLAAFDHAIVRATIGGRVYWLDGTRTGDTQLDDIQVPGFVWALPMQASGGALTRLTPAPLQRPMGQTSIRLDASAGLDLPAPAYLETVIRGDGAVALNAQLGEAGTSLDQVLRAYWRRAFSFVTPTKVTARFDPKAREERITLEGTAAMDWDGQTGGGRRYEADGVGLGWKADFTREPGPHADAPFAVDFPDWSETTESIVLPHRGEGFTLEGQDVDQQIGARAFVRKATLIKGVFSVTASTRSLASEFPAADAPAAAKALEALSKTAVHIRAPANYTPTAQELAALMASTPQTAAARLDRGVTLMNAGRHKEAAADFDVATKLDPKSAVAFADLALARFWSGDHAGAKVALADALALNPNEPIAWHAAGMLSLSDGDAAAAIATFSRGLELNSGDDFAREQRANAYLAVEDYDHALQDLDVLLANDPTRVAQRELRITIEMGHGKAELALRDADAAVGAAPDSSQAHLLRGGVLAQFGRKSEAMSEFARAIAIEPTELNYLTRERYRDDTDLAGKLADQDAALALGADADRIRLLKAEAEADAGVFDKALADADLAVAAKPDDATFRSWRAGIRARAHQEALAAADFAWIRTRAGQDPSQLNNLCWGQAILNVSLDRALADCDEAIAAASAASRLSRAAFLDSRAFVLLRLGRLDESIAAYNDALRLRPSHADSLFGRGVAELRAGAKAKGEADLAAARALDARIDKTFAGYGVTP
jgi:tetratricopeptide (TPR) repeat protein